MGRASHSWSLPVWANGERVGTRTIPTRGETQFLYDRTWRTSALGRPLSLSLPYTGDQPLRGDAVRDYFDNLLPDSEANRKRLAMRYKLASIGAFDLLQEIGRDCVGAIQLLKEDEEPTDVMRIDGTPMSEEDVERHLVQITQAGFTGRDGAQDELRVSLAGAQQKTALLWHQGTWMRPHDATPTTYILKLPCQALGVPPHLKYENDGGPGLAELAAVLRGSERAQADLTTLLTSQVLFWLMAASDGHAKNFSIHLLAEVRYRLTPLYDVMSIWPIEGRSANQYPLHKAKLAMAVWASPSTTVTRMRNAGTSTAPPPGISCAPMRNLSSKLCSRAWTARSMQSPRGCRRAFRSGLLQGFSTALTALPGS